MYTNAVIPCSEICKCQVIEFNRLLFTLKAMQSALSVTPESVALPNSLDSSSAWSSSSFSPRSLVSTASSSPSISTQNNCLLLKKKLESSQSFSSFLSFFHSKQFQIRHNESARIVPQKASKTPSTAYFFIPEKKCFLIFPPF